MINQWKELKVSVPASFGTMVTSIDMRWNGSELQVKRTRHLPVPCLMDLSKFIKKLEEQSTDLISPKITMDSFVDEWEGSTSVQLDLHIVGWSTEFTEQEWNASHELRES